jgi:hypothetical protein
VEREDGRRKERYHGAIDGAWEYGSKLSMGGITIRRILVAYLITISRNASLTTPPLSEISENHSARLWTRMEGGTNSHGPCHCGTMSKWKMPCICMQTRKDNIIKRKPMYVSVGAQRVFESNGLKV